MDTIFFLFQQMMFFSIPLLIVALGGMFSERSGVINIALEGIMVMGAFASIFFLNKTQSFMSGQGQLLLAILVAAIAGMAFSFFHAYAAISLRSDQTISGTALNMFAPAFAIYMARTLQSNGVQQIQFTNTFYIQKVPLLGDIPFLGPLLFQNCYITTYVGIAILIVAAFFLYKTRFGLRLRSCGEHPQGRGQRGHQRI